MKNSARALVIPLAAICFSLSFRFTSHAQPQSPAASSPQKEAAVTSHAKGLFELKMTPLPPDDSAETAPIGRMSIEKQFHGDLEAHSKVQMLSFTSSVKGSAGYVAMEKVSGTLHGRAGTFVLQHSGTMTRGTPSLSVTVVPDSGTGQLTGLAGKMEIIITDGKHSYDFEYTLREAH